MIDDPLTHLITLLGGLLIGGMIAAVIVGGALSNPETHHRDAYDAHGNLTCEFCKALVEKGIKNGK